ncbi:histidine phosphatase family protein, partial [Nocardioides kribbensis]
MGLLLLVRHGQASFGADDYDVLSPTGWEQGRLLGASLAAAGARPTALVRGSMRRHRETLEALVDGAGRGSGDTGTPETPGVTVDAGWDEFDHLGVVGAHPDLLGDDAWSDRRAFQTA